MANRYDYSQTMMLKIKLAEPDNKGGLTVWYNFEKALELIKQIDNITICCPKIIYLVGWQYHGHDDKYPAFFECNEHLKRDCDRTAKESLLWLMGEAKRYHTTLSLHINLSDAYPDSPLWEEYIANDLILRRRNGELKVTGVWNGRTAYQVRFDAEYESGFYKKRVDKLLGMLPIEESGTIHVDAFFARKGKDTTIAREKLARIKMIKYLNDKGIDVTSEFIYREHKHGYRAHFGASDTIGLIPAYWKPVLSGKDVLKYPSSVLAGGIQCNALTLDKQLHWLFYGNIIGNEQGEELFNKNPLGWHAEFAERFATYNVPYHYLNRYDRLSIKGVLNGRKMYHKGGVVSEIKQKRISQNGLTLKENKELCLPIAWRENGYVAYSKTGGWRKWRVEGDKAKVYTVSKDGNTLLSEVDIINNTIDINTTANTMYYIEKI